jgi:hypothetical protein
MRIGPLIVDLLFLASVTVLLGVWLYHILVAHNTKGVHIGTAAATCMLFVDAIIAIVILMKYDGTYIIGEMPGAMKFAVVWDTLTIVYLFTNGS